MVLYMFYSKDCLYSKCQQCFTFLHTYQEVCKNFHSGTILTKEKRKGKEKETNQMAIDGNMYTK